MPQPQAPCLPSEREAMSTLSTFSAFSQRTLRSSWKILSVILVSVACLGVAAAPTNAKAPSAASKIQCKSIQISADYQDTIVIDVGIWSKDIGSGYLKASATVRWCFDPVKRIITTTPSEYGHSITRTGVFKLGSVSFPPCRGKYWPAPTQSRYDFDCRLTWSFTLSFKGVGVKGTKKLHWTPPVLGNGTIVGAKGRDNSLAQVSLG